jgi:DNA-binding transcriptional LysR family regulator
VSFADRFVDLAEKGVDVAVRIGGGDWPSALGHRRLGDERLIFCAAPARRGVPASADDLQGTTPSSAARAAALRRGASIAATEDSARRRPQVRTAAA